MKLLTESEVAERLHKSTATVQRLRLTGQLTYIPGRPVLVDEADLEIYIQAKKIAKEKKNAPPTEEERMQAARERARKTWLLRRLHAQMHKRP